jgi:hypothetical protein
MTSYCDKLNPNRIFCPNPIPLRVFRIPEEQPLNMNRKNNTKEDLVINRLVLRFDFEETNFDKLKAMFKIE